MVSDLETGAHHPANLPESYVGRTCPPALVESLYFKLLVHVLVIFCIIFIIVFPVYYFVRPQPSPDYQLVQLTLNSFNISPEPEVLASSTNELHAITSSWNITILCINKGNHKKLAVSPNLFNVEVDYDKEQLARSYEYDIPQKLYVPAKGFVEFNVTASSSSVRGEKSILIRSQTYRKMEHEFESLGAVSFRVYLRTKVYRFYYSFEPRLISIPPHVFPANN